MNAKPKGSIGLRICVNNQNTATSFDQNPGYLEAGGGLTSPSFMMGKCCDRNRDPLL